MSQDHSPEEAFAERLKFEHDVISHRLTWLMTLNGFLVAAAAILTVNHTDIDPLLVPLFIALSLLGTCSNGSVLFSSWWATKAIEEASYALADWWETLDPEGKEYENRRLRMRLYGRDPNSFQGYRQPTPSKWLHPWLLLPFVFIANFVLMPQLAWQVAMMPGKKWDLFATISSAGWYWTLTPLIIPILLLAAFSYLDWKRNCKKDIWAMCYGFSPTYVPFAGERITKKRAREHHASQRKDIRQWIQENHDSKHFPKVLLKKPKPRGRIPAATYAHYRSIQEQTPPRED